MGISRGKMGRKLDLGGLQDSECQHILEVINRDFKLRQLEKERLEQHEKELKEEALKTALLEKQRAFNKKNTCIRCLDTFPILSFWKLSVCSECNYNVCRNCSELESPSNKYTCFICVKSRDLRVQTLTWFYDNVKSRFRRFGSAKVVRSLYKRKAHAPTLGLASDSETNPDTFAVSSNDLSSALDPAEFDFPLTPSVSRHIERFRDNSRSTIEDLREALADFLTDDDFESDRFKRMLYTFSLKFAGIIKRLVDGLETDISTDENDNSKDLARQVAMKEVDSMMGVDMLAADEGIVSRHDEEVDQYVGEVMVYKVMNDFKQEAAEYCAGLDDEDEDASGQKGDGADFGDMEARYVDVLNRTAPLPSFGTIDFEDDAAFDAPFNDNIVFGASKPRRTSDAESETTAALAARDLEAILEALPEAAVDDSTSIEAPSGRIHYVPTSDNELADIPEEEEEEEAASLNERRDSADGAHDSSNDVFFSAGSADPSRSSGGLTASRLFDTSAMYVPETERPLYARIGSRDALNYPESFDNGSLSRASSIDDADFDVLGAPNAADELKALSSEIVQRFSRLDRLSSGEEDASSSPRVVDDRRSTPPVARVSNPECEDPKFLVAPLDADVRRGEMALFDCVVAGTQPLDVFWYAPQTDDSIGEELEESVKHGVEIERMGISERRHRLRVFDVSEADAGQYSCVCVNDAGTNAAFFRLDARPNRRKFRAPEFEEELMDVEAIEGDDVTLRCRVRGYPQPRVIFERSGRLVERGERTSKEEPEEGVHVLVMRDVGRSADDRYLAVAVNAEGKAESAAEVTVDKKPMSPRPITVKPPTPTSPSKFRSFSPLGRDNDELVTVVGAARNLSLPAKKFEKEQVVDEVAAFATPSAAVENVEVAPPRREAYHSKPVAAPRAKPPIPAPVNAMPAAKSALASKKSTPPPPTTSTQSVDPLDFLRPKMTARPKSSGNFVEMQEGADLPGTEDLRRSGSKDSSYFHRRDYYVNRAERSDDPPRPSSSYDRRSSRDLYDPASSLSSRRDSGDGASLTSPVSSPRASSAAEPTATSSAAASFKKAMPSVKELSAMFDRRVESKPVDQLLRFGSITARSLPKKGRDFFQDVVRPASSAAPIVGPNAGSSVPSSLRSSFGSIGGTNASSVDGDHDPSSRSTPDGASFAGEEEEERESIVFV